MIRDFNARKGRFAEVRLSIDERVDDTGVCLLEFCKNSKLVIFNGRDIVSAGPTLIRQNSVTVSGFCITSM